MIRILLKFFRFCPEDYRKKFYCSIALSILIAVCRAMRIPAIAILLDGILQRDITNARIWGSFLLLLAAVIFEGFLKGKATSLQTEAGYGTACDKRIEIAEHLRYLPMGYFNRNTLGEITSIATNTMENLQGVATRVVMLVSEGVLTTLLIAVALLFFDLRIGLILIAGCIVYALVNAGLQKQSEKMSPIKTRTDVDLVDHVLEYIQGLQEVKAYGLTGSKSRQLDQAIDRNVKANTDMEMALVPYMALQSIVTKATGVVMSLCSVWFYLHGSMNLLTCIIMIICSFMVYSSLESAGNYSGLLRIVDLSIDRADGVLQLPTMKTEGKTIVPEHHDMETQNIAFAYEKTPVIQNVSVKIPDRSVTALVGPSGSGKTTFASLLARFWDVSQGRILLDGRDVRDYSMDSLMENFSFVFQNVYLFHETIADNIRFGRPDAPMEEVMQAAKKAGCHDFIMALPDGYDTVLEENGSNLSGGERQRISIARAMMKDSPIVILDEATANVDPENEELLMKAIQELTRKKTVIMIAHRLKTVQNADQILVLEKGMVTERGTHEELAGREGTYRRFLQAREYAEHWEI